MGDLFLYGDCGCGSGGTGVRSHTQITVLLADLQMASGVTTIAEGQTQRHFGAGSATDAP